MKTLIIPDIHQRVNSVKWILDNEKDYDEVVFLGDWFDSFYDPPKVAGFKETCEYLKFLVLDHPNKNKFVFLIGNHDLSYIYENKNFSSSPISKTLKYFCSGFTASKAKKFRHTFFDQGLKDNFFLENFKIAHITQGWTLSHGGISVNHIPFGYNVEKLVNELLPDVWKNFRNLEYNHNWLLSGAGFCRGGFCKVGGVLWHDWRQEFNSCIDLGKQVVGHTTVKSPDCVHMNTPFESWNLDTEKDYGIIIDGRLITKSIKINNNNETLRHDDVVGIMSEAWI